MIIRQVISFDLGNLFLAYTMVRVTEFFFGAVYNRILHYIREGR